MKKISGNIFDLNNNCFIKGTLFFDNLISRIKVDESVNNNQYILPGLIDAHIHIESSMLSPVEYSRESLKHGVVAAVTDPHEIANVCGMEGINFMVENSKKTPMKIFTGIPSCVPATIFESSGSTIGINETESLFKSGKCSHLSEMMNFPGLLNNDPDVIGKINLAFKYHKKIDGHAPMLSGDDLKKYIDSGISTDHECTTLNEALEKISLGMKIMLRESSASHDFNNLDNLIELKPDSIMFCTDDCHPDDLQQHYLDDLVRRSIKNGYSLFNIFKASTLNAINHYELNVGFLRPGDYADFIIVDNLDNFNILKTFIDGVEVFNGKQVLISDFLIDPINKFYSNIISVSDIQIKTKTGIDLQVIEVIPDSLITKHISYKISDSTEFFESDISNDLLKIVVINRYSDTKPAVGFIKGFSLNSGAIGTSVAHDSHNLIVIGKNDDSIVRAIQLIQEYKGGMVLINNNTETILPLPLAGLMSDKSCDIIAREYKKMNKLVKEQGCKLKSPFMTMSFMALLVIPELKLSDKGLFDVNNFKFIDLQS